MSSTVKDETPFNPRPRRSRDSATLDTPSRDCSPPAFSGDVMAFPAVSAHAPAMNFRVNLDIFRGPLDLLLYLVRKHEVDIVDIPISLITEQYVMYLDVLEQLDVDAVGDFIEMASLLIEIKSRTVLPQAEDDEGNPVEDDAREELVKRLLEYKMYKDAASMLGESAQEWQQRFSRVANDLPTREVDPAKQAIHEVELWDLVSAMGRIMRESELAKPPTIVYDDTPIHVHMQRIHDHLIQEQRISFTSMFRAGMHKGMLIGVFLAVLELVRNYGVIVEQEDLHSVMWLTQSDDFRPTLELSEVYSSQFEEDLTVPSKPR